MYLYTHRYQRRFLQRRSIAVLLFPVLGSAAQEWPVYGGGPEDTHYSSLAQINRTNVASLQTAWSYDAADGPGGLETSPIIVHGVLFGISPAHKIFALNAATGKLIWIFDSKLESRGPNRGVTYWESGRDRRIFATVRSFVYALNADNGRPVPSFGENGRIDLREHLGRPAALQSVLLTSPGVVYKDLLIVGGRTAEDLPAAPGDVRAFDARSGKLRWSFHTIPHPGEFGYDTWPKDAWQYIGSANNWAGMAVDNERGIVYVPTGSAAADFDGTNRLGDNLFANTLLALNAATGERIWHFQAVRHDIWDRDFPSPPTLVTVRHDGRRVDAVAQTTKHGYVFLFDRANGQPLFPIAFHKFPPSTVPGEIASETQPLPTAPEPFARQRLTEEMLTKRTPEAHQWALEAFRELSSAGQFLPFSLNRETVIFPGFDGGAEWGGSAFDPQTGLLFVNSNDVPWTSSLLENKNRVDKDGRDLYLHHCANCHRDNLAGAPPQFPSLVGIARRRGQAEIRSVIQNGAGRMPSFPSLAPAMVDAVVLFITTGQNIELPGAASLPVQMRYRFAGYHKFQDPQGYPAVEPPWGTLSAIDLNTGAYRWKIPLGEYPELAAQGIADTGTENYGGPIVTAGGLVFIASTNFDRKFRAFDKDTGKLLWETTLPFAGNATPATYEVSGRQFIVIAAGGGKAPNTRTGATYVAYSLPDRARVP